MRGLTMEQYYGIVRSDEYLEHFGVRGQKWGIRRYQNPDGTLTEAGKKRYYNDDGSFTDAGKKRLYEDAKNNIWSRNPKKHRRGTSLLNELEESEYLKAQASRLDASTITEKRTRDELVRAERRNDPDIDIKGKAYRDAKDESSNFRKQIVKELLGKYGVDKNNEYTEAGFAVMNQLFSNSEQRYERIPMNAVEKAFNNSSKNSKDFNKIYQRALKEAEKSIPYLHDQKIDDTMDAYLLDLFDQETSKKAKHSDLSEDFLEHWGILGMKWGVRRYQNKDGSLTSAGRKRYASGKNVGFFEARRLKKKRVEAAKKRQATLEAKKKAEEDAQRHEAEKQEAIRSGNATQIAKFQNELSNQELRDVLARLDSKQKLSELVAKETPKKETKLDKAMKIAEKGAKYAEVAEKGIKVYNTFAKVSNAFADDNNQLPIIGEKREKKAPKNEAKEAAIRSGDAKEIAKWKGKLTPEETKTAMLTLDYWDKIKEKSVSSTVKEQREGQKAAAKELAEKLSTHSDEYNEAVKRARDLDYHIKEQNRAERKQRVDEAKTALKELVNPSDRTRTIREYSNAEIGSKEVIDRILKDLEKNRR